MENAQQIIVLIKLIFGGFGVFLAIIVWSRTVDSEWFFLALAIIAFYADIILSALYSFGLFSYPGYSIGDVNIFRAVFEVLPLIFLFLGFLLKTVKNRH